MAVEMASVIPQLDTNLPYARDFIREGAEHLRLIKTVIRANLPNLDAVVNITADKLNSVGAIFQDTPEGFTLTFGEEVAFTVTDTSVDHHEGEIDRIANPTAPDSLINGRSISEYAPITDVYTGSEVRTFFSMTSEEPFDTGAVLDKVYPVGSVYITTTPESPATILNFGMWQRVLQGRVMVSAGRGSDDLGQNRDFRIGEEGGDYRSALTEDHLPKHKHRYRRRGRGDGTSGSNVGSWFGNRTGQTSITGTSRNDPHNNVEPYQVAYFWARISDPIPVVEPPPPIVAPDVPDDEGEGDDPSPPPITITIASNRGSPVEVGQQAQCTAVISPSPRPITWISSNSSIASITQTGYVDFKAGGSVSISATIPGRDPGEVVTSNTLTFTSVAPTPIEPTRVRISTTSNTDFTPTGSTVPFTAIVTPEAQGVTWSSSDTGVGNIDSNGIFTAVNSGSTQISALTEEGTPSNRITVNVFRAVSSIAISLVCGSVTPLSNRAQSYGHRPGLRRPGSITQTPADPAITSFIGSWIFVNGVVEVQGTRLAITIDEGMWPIGRYEIRNNHLLGNHGGGAVALGEITRDGIQTLTAVSEHIFLSHFNWDNPTPITIRRFE